MSDSNDSSQYYGLPQDTPVSPEATETEEYTPLDWHARLSKVLDDYAEREVEVRGDIVSSETPSGTQSSYSRHRSFWSESQSMNDRVDNSSTLLKYMNFLSPFRKNPEDLENRSSLSVERSEQISSIMSRHDSLEDSMDSIESIGEKHSKLLDEVWPAEKREVFFIFDESPTELNRDKYLPAVDDSPMDDAAFSRIVDSVSDESPSDVSDQSGE